MDKLPIARNVIKVVALVVGGLGTVLCTMAIVGLLTDNGWIRVAVALVFAIALPALLADRLMPEDPKQAEGVNSDVFAVCWMAITVGAALGAGAVTRPVLAAEGDRLARADMSALASALYLMAGVRPTDAQAEPNPTTSTSTTVPAATTRATSPPTSAIPFVGPPLLAAEASDDAGGAEPSPTASAGETSDAPQSREDKAEEREPPPVRRDHEIFSMALPSLVTVTTESPEGLRGATGVFVGNDLVATCRHLFAGATAARLTSPSGSAPSEKVVLVAEDVAIDLAIVRISPQEGIQAAMFPSASGEPTGAERAVIVGDPLGLGPTLAIADVTSHEPPAAPALSIAIGDAMLGSPVFDERSRLIGIVTAPQQPQVIPVARIAELLATPLPEPRAFAPTSP